MFVLSKVLRITNFINYEKNGQKAEKLKAEGGKRKGFQNEGRKLVW